MTGKIMRLGGLGAAAVLTLGGCITVPVYDAKSDDLLTELQSDTDTFLIELAEDYSPDIAPGKPCAYATNRKFYRGARVKLNLISVRANALYNNAPTLEALGHLKDTFAALETAHKGPETSNGAPIPADQREAYCLKPALLIPTQTAMDSAVGALLQLELAKK